MLNAYPRARSSKDLWRFVAAATVSLPGLVFAAVINGTAGNDVLTGTPDADTIDGKAGRDEMMGLGGNDTYVVSQADDVVIEGAGEGTDTVRSPVTFALPIFVENLVLIGTATIRATGNTLNNRLTGNDSNNTLDGRSGGDTMIGLAGQDTYIVDTAADVVTEAANGGTDLINSSVTYTLPVNVEKLTLTGTAVTNGVGNALSNFITGNAANNGLQGLDGNDTMDGGGGNDQLVGGNGNDRLTGGPGLDIFRFDSALNATTNVDTITDFAPMEDVLRLEGKVFTALTVAGTLGAGAFRLGAVAGDASDRILYDSATGFVRYDADGNGPTAAVIFAALIRRPTDFNDSH